MKARSASHAESSLGDKLSRLTAIGIAVLALALSSHDAQAQVLRCITWVDPPSDAEMWTINPTTGVIGIDLATLVEHPVGFAQSPSDPRILYAISALQGLSNSTLYSVRRNENGSTTTTTIGSLGLQLFEGDMAFDPGGQLYALTRWAGGTSPSTFLSINTTTGAATSPIGITGSPNSPTGFANHSDMSAMAFAPNGDMYVIDNSDAPSVNPTYLLKVNKTTGAVITSTLVSDRLTSPLGMVFNSSGTLYVAGQELFGSHPQLYTLSLSGTLTPIGTSLGLASGVGVSGLAFSPADPVPATSPPAIAGLALLMAVVGVATLRRRKVEGLDPAN